MNANQIPVPEPDKAEFIPTASSETRMHSHMKQRINIGISSFFSIRDSLGYLGAWSIIAPRIWRECPSCLIVPTPLFVSVHGSHPQNGCSFQPNAVPDPSQLIHPPCDPERRPDDPVEAAREGPVSPHRSACQPFRNRRPIGLEYQDRPAGRCRSGTRHCRQSRVVLFAVAASILVLPNDTKSHVDVP